MGLQNFEGRDVELENMGIICLIEAPNVTITQQWKTQR